MELAKDASLPQVRALATRSLVRLRGSLDGDSGSAEEQAHAMLLSMDIQKFLDRPLAAGEMPGQLNQPPGSPIGDPGMLSGSGLLGDGAVFIVGDQHIRR